MKRQLLGLQSGFTLIELMLVIGIISIFIAATASFNWKPRTDSERSELLMVSLAGRIRTEIQNVTIGRMPAYNGNALKYTEITIGTGGMTIIYKTGSTATVAIGSTSFLRPFFEGDLTYQIQSVTWTGGTTAVSGTGILAIGTNGITFTGATNITDNIYVDIRVRYNNATRRVIIDRRTGKITERKF